MGTPTTPPGPRGKWGGLNHLTAIRDDFRRFSHDLHQQYGDVVHYRVFNQSIYQFASPEWARRVLIGSAKLLRKPDNQKKAFARIIGKNLFTSDGDAWVQRQRLLQPLFQPSVVERYRSIIERRAREAFKNQNDGVSNLSDVFNRIAVLAVAESLFGTAVHDVVDEFLEIASELQGAVSRQILSPFLLPLFVPTRDHRTIREALRFFHELIGRLIATRRNDPSHHEDLLTRLLHATDETGTQKLSDREAMDEALTMLLAGSDTTAAALSWSALLLAQHPEVQGRLVESLERDEQEGIAEAGTVFQEAMRLYPPAIAIARQAPQELALGEYTIPASSLVFVSVYSIQRDARWFENANAFYPARFSRSDFCEDAYLPFGLGPRACIGKRFAMMEGPIVLAELVKRFQIELTREGYQPELETQLSLHPKGGVELELLKRPARVAN